MSLSTYLLYLAAVALLVLSPGPTMLMCMTNSLQHGPRKALAAAAGSVTAVLGTMLLSALGLGALLAASETAFWVLKAAGAAYLIWLGIKTFRSQTTVFDEMPANGTQTKAVVPARKLYIQGLIVGGSNPKALLFFTAVLPPFLDVNRPAAPQLALFAVATIGMDVISMSASGLGGAALARRMGEPRFRRGFGVAVGLMLLLASVLFNVPFMFQPIQRAFESIPHNLNEAAQVSGLSTWAIFLKVELPLAWPGILSAMVLTFVHTLGEFGVVLMIGGSIPGETRTLAISIYDSVQSFDLNAAHTMSLALLVFSLVAVASSLWLSGRRKRPLQ